MPPGHTITTARMTDLPALTRLLWFASPSFPTGGFAYSHGLEWAVEAGDVPTEAALLAWLEIHLRNGAGWTDAILARHAHRAANDPAALTELADLAASTATSRERLLETVAQGEAFAAAAATWGVAPRAAYPVAFGAFAAHQDVAEDEACAAFLAASVGNLVSAGIRLVPLGQTAGLRVLRALEPTLAEVAEATAAATLEDLGTACFAADIAAMRHETQHTRIFRS
jgi:urease accessory protein